MNIGVTQVDKDHAEIADCLNQCFLGLNAIPFQAERFGKSVVKLLRTTAAHFEREEAMMRQFDYPEYAAHQRQHESIKARYLKALSMYKARRDFGSAEMLYALELELFATHLRDYDRPFGVFVDQLKQKSFVTTYAA